MDILVRGKYVITDAGDGEEGIITDGAALLSGGKIMEVGGYKSLKKKYPHASIKGNGEQLVCSAYISGAIP